MKPDLLIRVREALSVSIGAQHLPSVIDEMSGLVRELDEVLAAIDPDTGLQVADLVACCSDNDRLLDKAQEECAKLRSELAEMERPLDAQMARLNAALIQANEENLQLRLARDEADDVAAAALAALSQRAGAGPAAAPRAGGSTWNVVCPVPAEAPVPQFLHYARTEAPEHIARYQRDGVLFGYVVRWRTPQGGKEVMPHTWCTSQTDTSKWHWKVWPEPRPLYLPGGTSPAGRTVVLVEGEKKADALHQLLEAGAPGVYCVTSWYGGTRVWGKADWSWLRDATVMLWPDADQAGVLAMLQIGSLLKVLHGCQIHLLPIPVSGAVAEGWDCADAIAEGWDARRVIALFAQGAEVPR